MSDRRLAVAVSKRLCTAQKEYAHSRWYHTVMPNQKKSARNWYIAATYYLTVGILMFAVAMALFGLNYSTLQLSGLLFEVGTYVLWLPVLYVAGRYAGNYVSGRYLIREPEVIVRYVLIYNIFFAALTWGIVAYQAYGSGMLLTLGTTLGILSTIANIYIIYFAAKKFIRATI
jgi:hypothetical protein